MFETGCIVVGAGVIGLAVARRLALNGRDVVVLERASNIGTETSSRSNEVIHAGIYYRTGGPQAVLCVQGREALLAYCAEHGVRHEQIGKLIVASDRESVEWLEGLHARAVANGALGLEMISGEAASRMEPNLLCCAAMHSPRTCIVDTHGLMLAYRGDAESSGAAIALRSAFVGARRLNGGFEVEFTSVSAERTRMKCELLVNAAGIWAPQVAGAIEGMSRERIPHINLAKGCFFKLRGKAPFRRLIIPEPKIWRKGGIFTLDLANSGRFGPDQEWVDKVDYGVEGRSTDEVYAMVRRYFPALPDGSLTPDYAGIRPRLHGPDMAPADWLFQGEREHGIRGLLNLYGFETPGITASLAVAEVVADMLDGRAPPFEVDPTQYGTYRPPELAEQQTP